MKNTIRNTLLVTVAATALIAGAGLASAQGTGENREAPGAATQQPKAPGGKMDQQPNGAPQKSPAPNAQAPMKPAPTAQAPAKETPAPTAQTPMKEKPAETAQAPAAVKPQAAEHGGNAQTSEPPNSRMAPSTARDETKSGPPAALSTEQHAKNSRHVADRKVRAPGQRAFLNQGRRSCSRNSASLRLACLDHGICPAISRL